MKIERTGDKAIITLYDFDYCPSADMVRLDLSKIDLIIYVEVSGDECIDVYYKDGSSEWFDSSTNRGISYFDDMYPIFYNGEFDRCDVEEI